MAKSILRRASGAALLFLAFAFLTGCDSGPKIVKVSGTVLIDGKPLTHGFVQIAPEGYRAASGKIGPDGRFTLTTTNPDDGIVLGTHAAAVIGVESIDGASQRWHAPKKLSSIDTSGLTVTITGSTDSLLIEISWEGGAPFIERFNAE